MTLSQILAEVRLLLDEPNAQHPSLRQLLSVAQAQIQQFHNELQNTAIPWNINSTVLSVAPDQDEYLMMAPDFGKVRFILTEDTASGFVPWEVRIVDPENFDHFGQGQATPYVTDKHNALAMAFYGKGGFAQARFVKVTPMPAKSADYRIWYDVGQYSPGGLGDELIMPEFHHLIVTRVALASIPYARWEGMDADLTGAHRQELAEAIRGTNALYEDAFERYRTNQRQEQMAARRLFGDEEMAW